MRFLVTNDDGFEAAGIRLLAKVAAKFGDVTVVAPECEQSGMSHRITFDRGLKFKQQGDVGSKVYSVDGTPADCVRIAVATMNQDFDCVLSGVNDGGNLGVDVYYSGTVAAAREAALLGLPAMAISQYRSQYTESFDWESQEPVIERLLGNYLEELKNKKPIWLNCNLPDPIDCGQQESEFVECETDQQPLPNQYSESPDGFAMSFRYRDRPRKEGRDLDVCFGGNVSVCRFEISP